MNGPLNFTAEALAQEATTLVQKLSAGLHTLPEVDDVHYGATQKQEVWRDGKVVLDFNRAYNPPCAFTPYATCPLPPAENRPDLLVDAGEKAYAKPIKVL